MSENLGGILPYAQGLKFPLDRWTESSKINVGLEDLSLELDRSSSGFLALTMVQIILNITSSILLVHKPKLHNSNKIKLKQNLVLISYGCFTPEENCVIFVLAVVL